MQNRTEGTDSPNRPDRGIDTTTTNAVATESCPLGTIWCADHFHPNDGTDDKGWCWSRTIPVDEAKLAISNGTHDGTPKLWGLGEFESDSIPLDQALAVVAAVAALLGEVGR